MSTPIRAIFESGHLRLLDPVDLAEGQQVNVAILEDQEGKNPSETHVHLSARDLMKLPLAERNRILEERATRAEAYYRSDPALTDFEAFDEHDLYDETP